MKPARLATAWVAALTLGLVFEASAAPPAVDPRLREVAYDPNSVVAVPVKRGVVTLVVLGPDEAITEIGSGLSADCAKPEAAWCVAAQPGGRTVFVKPKSTASAANNLAIVTDRRVHNLRLDVLADNDPRPAVYRLIVRAPAPPGLTPRAGASQPLSAPLSVLPLLLPSVLPVPAMTIAPTPQDIVAERMQAEPQVVNAQYSLAEGKDSQDIVPTLVFDDGRFTYLRFPGNREVPAVFHVLGDGTETLVNTRMQDDLLVVDRMSRRLMLRAGAAVIGLWNEAFDLEGVPPGEGTTVPGVQRLLKAEHATSPQTSRGATP